MISLGLIIVFSSFAFSNGEDYLELTKDNFEGSMQGLDLTLVKFYAEWCGHCKRMAPEFAKAATRLLKNDPPVHLVKVNCPDNDEVCQKFSVSGYPTLKVFRKGELLYDYDGPRDEDGIVDYMASRAGPPSVLVKSEAELDKLLTETKTVILGLFKESSGANDLYNKFIDMAGSLQTDFRFAHTHEPALLKKYGVENGFVRILPKRYQSKLEESFVKYAGSSEITLMKSWITDNWGGLLPHQYAQTSKLLVAKPMATIYFKLDYERDLKGTNYVRNRLLKAIKQLKESGSKLHFCMASAKEASYELSNSFGLKDLEDNADPVITIVDEKGKKFVLREKFSYDAMKQFALDVVAGKVEPFIKSEDIPTTEEGPVTKLVAKNFDSIVRDPAKEALVEFYAPWCGHCKNLKPVYEELATKMKGEVNIVIGAMDATANDVPSDFAVQGFPTIYWVPKGDNKKPQQYSGGRDVQSFEKFIKANSVNYGAKTEL